MSVGNLLVQNAIRFPDKVAVVVEERKITYRQLNENANRLARGLSDLGLEKGTKAAMFLGNCYEWPEIYFALSKIGAVIVPINYRLMGRELFHIITHSDSEVVFLDERTCNKIEPVRAELGHVGRFITVKDLSIPWCISLSSLIDGFGTEEPDVFIDGEDLHTISYTSGTTSLPKGAVLTNLNVMINHALMTTVEFGVRRDDVFLVTTPLCQRIGWGKLVNSVAIGCKIVILPSFDYTRAMEMVQKEKVTIMSIIPTIGRMLLRAPDLESYDTSSLKMFFVTGEMFPMELKKALSERFPHVQLAAYFAQTEAGLMTILFPEDIFRKPGSVGVPFIGMEVRIVDGKMKEVPVGESGEIIVRSYRPGVYGVMKEYYKDPKANEETFRGEWIRTGDIGKKDQDGHF
ncbi:MAG: AMP-binding protein, partial [Deltaproteobacteria bacterium]|nr:AMP-binding protein [Deltaproteobacteria bacterium]